VVSCYIRTIFSNGNSLYIGDNQLESLQGSSLSEDELFPGSFKHLAYHLPALHVTANGSHIWAFGLIFQKYLGL